MMLSRHGFGVGLGSPLIQPRQTRLVAVAAKKQQKKKREKGRVQLPVDQRIAFDKDGYDDEQDNERYMDSWQGSSAAMMPRAPSPAPDTSKPDGEGSGYVVFALKPSNIEQIRGGSWSWDDGDDADMSRGSSTAAPGPPIPEWNPRTGFMGAVAAAAEREREASGGSASTSTSATRAEEDLGVQAASLLTPVASDAPLPAVSKGQVLSSCLGAGFWMTLLALFLRQYAQVNAPQVLGTDPRVLAEFLRVPPGFETWQNVGIIVGAVVMVTGIRLQLMSMWPEFRTATERSNKQVLEPLGWLDILLVAAISGVSEEVLFRGAIIPASFPDWRGAVLAGAIFGLLHNSGGRNLSFAAWASAVGVFYGGLFVCTHNIWVPASAHALANFCSAAAWKARSEGKE